MVDAVFKVLRKVMGSQNERELKRLGPRVQAINALEPKYEGLTDAQLREEADRLRDRVSGGETLDDILHDSFALVREVSKRTPPPGAEKGLRHYDVQLVGGMVLHEGKIAEMATGEGKTLVATLPCGPERLLGRRRARDHGQRLSGVA